MQIKIYEEYRGEGSERGDNLANYIEEKLRMSFSGDGELETIRSEICNITTTFSKLLEKLAEKKVIDLKDISKFLNTMDSLEKEKSSLEGGNKI